MTRRRNLAALTALLALPWQPDQADTPKAGPAQARPILRERPPLRHRTFRLPGDYPAWQRVAVCESGGWRVLGAAYPDPVGITAANWAAAGGRPLPTGPVPLAQRPYVIRIADRFRRRYGMAIPDQTGCAAW